MNLINPELICKMVSEMGTFISLKQNLKSVNGLDSVITCSHKIEKFSQFFYVFYFFFHGYFTWPVIYDLICEKKNVFQEASQTPLCLSGSAFILLSPYRCQQKIGYYITMYEKKQRR